MQVFVTEKSTQVCMFLDLETARTHQISAGILQLITSVCIHHQITAHLVYAFVCVCLVECPQKKKKSNLELETYLRARIYGDYT